MAIKFLEGPFLKSRSIYDFVLDEHLLIVEDYDLIVPNRDVLLPMGNYSVKRINSDFLPNHFSQIYQVTNMLATNMDEAYIRPEPHPNAKLCMRQDGKVILEVVAQEGLMFSPKAPLLLSLRYLLHLRGGHTNLLYAGAIQPTDYSDFKRFFGSVIPEDSITKEIVVTSRAPWPYSLRCFDASKPEAFGMEIIPEQNSTTEQFSTKRWGFFAQPGVTSRASYFAVSTGRQVATRPTPEVILEDAIPEN